MADTMELASTIGQLKKKPDIASILAAVAIIAGAWCSAQLGA
jgi:hypothetical protein